jgi:hypothetical protein
LCPVTSEAFDVVNCCAAIATWLERLFSPKPCATSFTAREPTVYRQNIGNTSEAIGNAAGRGEELAGIAAEDASIEPPIIALPSFLGITYFILGLTYLYLAYLCFRSII